MRTLLLLSFALACRPDATARPDAPPTFDDVERVVTVGDNIGSNPSYSRSYIALLQHNDDDVFPAFAGSDLATRLGDPHVVRLDRGGDSYYALAGLDAPICTCDAGCGDPCVDPADDRPTLVVVQLGVNDLVATALALLSDPALRADLTPALDALRADVRTVLAVTRDPAVFPTPPLVVVTNVPDPSDGVGDLAELVTGLFPFPGADAVTPELARALIAGSNAVIEDEARAIGADVVDLHGAFLGHGQHYADEQIAAYDADDPTFWYFTLVDPNYRGAHEIRRELWHTLTGDRITAIPTDLPVESQIGLPDVPDDGWATAVTASDVTVELVDDAGATFPNVAADPERALGPPSGATEGVVALGVIGAWMELALASPATDGDGEDLVVLEFGAASGGTPEPYRVFVSDGPDGPWVQLGDASGERAFDLADAGLAQASHVRIESLAQAVDVLGGLGSPYYPGPEFDAVGAVYPR